MVTLLSAATLIAVLHRLLRPSLGWWALIAAVAAVITAGSLLGSPGAMDLPLALILALLAEAARGRRAWWLGAMAGLIAGGSVAGPGTWIPATFAGSGLLLLWIWGGDQCHLRQAVALGAGAAAAAVLAPSAVTLTVIVAWTAAMAVLQGVDRRWPVDCVYCRFFRAAIAATVAPAVAVVAWPELLPPDPTWPRLTSEAALSWRWALPGLAVIGAAVAFERGAGSEQRVFAICLLGLSVVAPAAVSEPRWDLAVQVLAMPPALWLAAEALKWRRRAA